MKKYKLIKEYPNSPKLNTEIIDHNDYYEIVDKTILTKGFSIPNDIVKYSEFWEEVVEKEYQILSFTVSDYEYVFNPLLNAYVYNTYRYDLKSMLDYLTATTNPTHIHSVKRLSDGEVFTVGDDIECVSNKKNLDINDMIGKKLIIEQISINNGDLKGYESAPNIGDVFFKTNHLGYWVTLIDCIKYKDKIIPAENFISNSKESMIEFAKMHVKNALQAAADKVEFDQKALIRQSILQSYSLDNIK